MSRVLLKWPNHEPLCLEAIKRLYRPNYQHRFHHVELNEISTVSNTDETTYYLLHGKCVLKFDDSAPINITRGDSFTLSDAHRFGVINENDASLLSVTLRSEAHLWDLYDAAEYLEDHGIFAEVDRPIHSYSSSLVVSKKPDFNQKQNVTTWQEQYRVVFDRQWVLKRETATDAKRFESLDALCAFLIKEETDENAKRITRDEAINLLASHQVDVMNDQDKLEILQDYLFFCDDRNQIDEAIEDGNLPANARECIDILLTKKIEDPNLHSLRPLLLDSVERSYLTTTNAFIKYQLEEHGENIKISGHMPPIGRCPCCRYLTIDAGEDGLYELCELCGWEHGGDGPNQMTLAEAQTLFEKQGYMCKLYAKQPLPPFMFRRGY